MATQFFSPSMVSPQALAQQLKATQQLTPATLGPDILARQLQLQQDTANAQRLLNDASTPLQAQMVSGHYVAPSWTQQAAQALKQYIGMKAANDLPKQYMDLQQAQLSNAAQAFGLGPQAQGSTQPYPVGASGNPPQGQPMGGAPASQATMPLLPGKTAAQSFQAYMTLGPEAYTKAVLDQSKPTDLQNNLLAMGIQPGSPQWNQALGGAVSKAGYIAPTVVAPGGSLVQPGANSPSFIAPKDGIQLVQGQNGTQALAIPGYADANASIEGAQARATAAGQASQDLVSVPDGKGGTIQMPRDQAAQVLRGNVPGRVPDAGQGSPGSLGTTQNPKVQEARSGLPQVLANADQMLKTIDDIDKAPGLSRSVGMMSLLPTRPGSESADANAKIDQLKGQVFLQAYQALRGGGAITEVEGAKAENALARLQVNQSEAGFRSALKDIRDVVMSARNRAYQQAGMTAPDASGIFSPKSAAEFQNVPSGAMFRDPNGVLRRKP